MFHWPPLEDNEKLVCHWLFSNLVSTGKKYSAPSMQIVELTN